jgi:DNA polymerase I-like protein with 3'-5' exonuclease and polymerase domains
MYDWIDEYRKKHGVLKDDFSFEFIPFDIIKTYAAIDAVVTFLLYAKIKPAVTKNKKLDKVYKDILIPASTFLIKVQDNGVPFDIERLKFAQKEMQKSIDESIEELYKEPKVREFEEAQGKPFNPNSVMQLRSFLFDYLGLQPTGKKTSTDANSTDAEVLKELSEQHHVPKLILNIRQKSKIKNTYLDKIIPQLDRDQRLRTNFNIHGTTSGRLSSSGKLNLQQLPRDNSAVKGSIKATPGHKIVSVDLTTAEVYVAAVLSNDKELMGVFKSGGDFHSTIAKKVFNLECSVDEVKKLHPLLRQAAKAITFGIMYGAGPSKISWQVTKDAKENGLDYVFTEDDAKEAISAYFKQFKGLKNWITKNQDFIAQNGYIYSFFGRKRRLPNVLSTDRAVKGHAVRSGLNFLVQSPASDVNLLAGIDMQSYIDRWGMKARIFALVHDSILAEVPDDEVDHYIEKLTGFIKTDRGLSIPGSAIGCDFDVGEDYSFGKFEEQYATMQ